MFKIHAYPTLLPFNKMIFEVVVSRVSGHGNHLLLLLWASWCLRHKGWSLGTELNQSQFPCSSFIIFFPKSLHSPKFLLSSSASFPRADLRLRCCLQVCRCSALQQVRVQSQALPPVTCHLSPCSPAFLLPLSPLCLPEGILSLSLLYMYSVIPPFHVSTRWGISKMSGPALTADTQDQSLAKQLRLRLWAKGTQQWWQMLGAWLSASVQGRFRLPAWILDGLFPGTRRPGLGWKADPNSTPNTNHLPPCFRPPQIPGFWTLPVAGILARVRVLGVWWFSVLGQLQLETL